MRAAPWIACICALGSGAALERRAPDAQPDQIPSTPPGAPAGTRVKPTLALFLPRDTAAGEQLARSVLDDAERRRRLERHATLAVLDARQEGALFARAFGQGGRLGTALLDHEGSVVASRAGYTDAAELERWLERCARRLQRWLACREDPLGRGCIAMELQSWVQAEQLLQRASQAPSLTPAERWLAGERLARCLARRGRVREAREVLGRLGPVAAREAARTRLTEGLLLLAEREPGAAVQVLRDARVPGSEPLEEGARLLALAQALHESRTADSLAPLVTLSARHRDSPWLGEAVRLIEHILGPGDAHSH